MAKNLGELVITFYGDKLTVESYKLLPADDTIDGDRAIADEIDKFKRAVSEVAFASRGYSIDQPLAVVQRDIPNTFTDIAAGTILANLCTDAFRSATKADLSFTANGMMRSGFIRGNSGVQTVYDVFAVAPLGAGVVDTTAGSTLVTGYFTGQELKNILEFFLVDSPAHPGEYFPRASGMRFRYDPSRPQFDVVTAIEMGDIDRAALGRLVAGVAHEINSPVGTSLTVASSWERKITLFAAEVEQGNLKRSSWNNFLDLSRTASSQLITNLNRAAELIQSFKQVATDRTHSNQRLFDLGDLTAQIVMSLRPGLEKQTMIFNLERQPNLTMNSYPGPYGQVLTNLFSYLGL